MVRFLDYDHHLFEFSLPSDFVQQEAYTEAAKEIHGSNFDVMNSPLDATAVYKKHGHFLMGAGYISTPTTVSEVRTTSSGSTDDVHPGRRLQQSTDRVFQLEAKLQEEIEARQRLEQMFQVS